MNLLFCVKTTVLCFKKGVGLLHLSLCVVFNGNRIIVWHLTVHGV